MEECPVCEHSAGGSTARHAVCKFIFGGRGRGGYKCHACGINSLEELETALQEKDANWEPWSEPVYKRANTSVSEDWEGIKGPADTGWAKFLAVFPKAQLVPDADELIRQLPNSEEVQKAWDAAASSLSEIRKGLEVYTDEEGKEKTHKKSAHIVEAEVLAYVVTTLRDVMKARFFVDAYPYIFLPYETTIYDMHNGEAAYRILSRLGLLCTQKHYALVEENVHQKILFQGKSVHIEKFGCMRGDAIYVNNGRGGMIKITTDKFEEAPNGTDDVYMSNKHLRTWPALDQEKLADIGRSLGQNGGRVTDSPLCQTLNAYFDEDGKLTSAQYRQLVLMRYLSLFLGSENINLRPIMLAIGPQNSGKSTLWEKILWLFFGTDFTSPGLPPKLPDFIAAAGRGCGAGAWPVIWCTLA
jgi:hypothetical protein